jgi:hypothetical protein
MIEKVLLELTLEELATLTTALGLVRANMIQDTAKSVVLYFKLKPKAEAFNEIVSKVNKLTSVLDGTVEGNNIFRMEKKNG